MKIYITVEMVKGNVGKVGAFISKHKVDLYKLGWNADHKINTREQWLELSARGTEITIHEVEL